MLLPNDSLTALLGDRTSKAFAKHLGLRTVSDLLQHFPRRYSTRGELTPIAEIPIGESVTVVADVVDVRERFMRGKAGSILEVRITDGEGFLSATFFNQAWRAKELKPGSRGLFAGKISSYQGKLQLSHPDYELFAEDIDEVDAKRWAELPIPIYPASAKVTTWMIGRAVGVLLDVMAPIEEELPAEVVAQNRLLSLDQAIRDIHRPEKDHDWQEARDTLRFHEAFLLQSTLLKRRSENATVTTTPRAAGKLLEAFDAALPFTLTKGQVEVGNDLLEDLANEHPMHRIAQRHAHVAQHRAVGEVTLPAADGQLLAQVMQQRIGQSQVAFSVFKVDRVDFVRHG